MSIHETPTTTGRAPGAAATPGLTGGVPGALVEAAGLLCCPTCRDAVTVEGRPLRCAAGHSQDVAKQGHVNLLRSPAGAAADDAAMVAARHDLLSSGVYSPVSGALTDLVAELAPDLPAGGVLDVGAGTGHYTSAVLEALPDRPGVAMDLSVYAARRAARAHPRLASLVADVWQPLPVPDNAMALVLDVFAPRNAGEFARVLAPGGVVLVVTPAENHLGELVRLLDMPRVDPRKSERLAQTFAAFETGPARRIATVLTVDGPTAARLARMGPAAHHVDRDRLDALASSPDALGLTLAVDVAAYRRT